MILEHITEQCILPERARPFLCNFQHLQIRSSDYPQLNGVQEVNVCLWLSGMGPVPPRLLLCWPDNDAVIYYAPL